MASNIPIHLLDCAEEDDDDDEDAISTCLAIKGQNTFMCPSTDNLKFVDMTAPGFSYGKCLNA